MVYTFLHNHKLWRQGTWPAVGVRARDVRHGLEDRVGEWFEMGLVAAP